VTQESLARSLARTERLHLRSCPTLNLTRVLRNITSRDQILHPVVERTVSIEHAVVVDSRLNCIPVSPLYLIIVMTTDWISV